MDYIGQFDRRLVLCEREGIQNSACLHVPFALRPLTPAGDDMSKNTKKTSQKIAALASETLRDPNTSKTARSLAASALAQANTDKQPSAEMERLASRTMQDGRVNDNTQALAASVLSQANKER